jgi:hypothetical protein
LIRSLIRLLLVVLLLGTGRRLIRESKGHDH